MHLNHPTLCPVHAKWGHIKRPLGTLKPSPDMSINKITKNKFSSKICEDKAEKISFEFGFILPQLMPSLTLVLILMSMLMSHAFNHNHKHLFKVEYKHSLKF